MADPAQKKPFSYDSVPLSDPSTEIRLLELHPASRYSDDLYCRIYTALISQPPSYIALSYAWGDNTKTHDISVVNTVKDERACTDTTGHSSLPLTSSIDTCLRHLRELQHREQVESKPLWIDQICINQEDNEEKSFQVLLMKDIFSSARQVIVWLGPAADDSDKVMDAFAEIGQEFLNTIGVPYSDENLYSGIDLLDANIDQPLVAYLLRKALKVFQGLSEGLGNRINKKGWVYRSWFTRLWTIQEFCLCKDTAFACGYKVVPERLVSAVNDLINRSMMLRDSEGLLKRFDALLYRYYLSGFEILERVFERRRHSLYLHLKESLQELLSDLFIRPTHLYVTCTDERDKVYGLLGIAGDVDGLGIRPDYSTSTTIAQVFTQTARAIIQKNKSLEIIRYGSLGPMSSTRLAESLSSPELDQPSSFLTSLDAEIKPKKETELLPSWVPDWKYRTGHTFQGIRKVFSACGKSLVADILPTSCSTTLGVRGFCVDTIVNIGDQEAPLDIYRNILPGIAFFDSFKRLIIISEQDECAKNIDGTTINYDDYYDDTLKQLLIGDQHIVLKGRPKLADRLMQSQYEYWMLYYDIWASREDDWKPHIAAYEAGDSQSIPAAQLRMREFLKSGFFMSWSIANGRRPYLTKRGYLGMGSAHLRPGDKVVVFHGDTIPYVVRPVPERGDSTYILVGETYCERVMNGELADTAEREDFYLI
ncbi:heterokaryon incompatibility protein [Pseudoneurospora amorphoporcata]|uniref:Heterokaryon incompatibility protein n=1 Tax=Pseudoneurospora amorphoporcata TaxID=241081 RepID=A0AAN6NN62_9PEZI|nr:heterokaryon incompatibility protein [Pseudoneurospora amorphoporcata]